MKSLITFPLLLGSLLLYGCASTTTNPRGPASCHDDTTNSEDHTANHCNGDSTNSRTERGANPRL